MMFSIFLGSGAWICQMVSWTSQLGVWNCQMGVWNCQMGVWNYQMGVRSSSSSGFADVCRGRLNFPVCAKPSSMHTPGNPKLLHGLGYGAWAVGKASAGANLIRSLKFVGKRAFLVHQQPKD